MKHGGFKAACIVLSTCIAILSVHADDRTISLESRILESFDGDSGYSWNISSSKFATKNDKETFPKLAYVAVWPNSLHGNNKEGKDYKSLGIWGRFDRKGYNWIDVFPLAKDAASDSPAVEIPIMGRARMLDLWVWGSNFNYYMEAYVRDYKGVVHAIDMGDLNFEGWKNLRINIPESIPQSRRTLPRRQGLTLVKFRIWTRPAERVDDFQIYLDQLKVLTDTFESLFDGDELADPERVQELWSGGSSNQTK
ncbi:flagellar filament outer layer protein FlaA [Treponema sp.]